MMSNQTVSSPRASAVFPAAVALAAVVASLVLSLSASPASAQPTAVDDQMYSCNNKAKGPMTVTLKGPETELKDLISWMMTFNCKNFVFEPRITTSGKKVTIMAPVKMTPQQAYDVFLVALSTMGLTVVPKGNVVRIIESATARTETLPLRRGSPGNRDEMIRFILRPSYLKVDDLRNALAGMQSPAGQVSTVGSVLVITDYASQIRDMVALTKAVDMPGSSDGIYTIAVQNADAKDLQAKLSEILGLTGGAGQPPPQSNQRGVDANNPAAGGVRTSDVAAAVPSKILVDERSNSLLLVASEAAYLRVKALVARLDIPLDTTSGSSIHVYQLENAIAEELANTINGALQGQTQRPQAPGGGNVVGRPGTPQGRPDIGSTIEGQARVFGDKPTNSLVILSSGRDFVALKEVIKKLDVPRRQVFIEALVLEVQLSNDTTLGSSSHGGVPVLDGSLVLGGVQVGALRSISPASLASASGLIGGLIGAPLENSANFGLGTSIPSFGLLVQALASNANTNLLSAPHFVAIDNEKTEFSVGRTIPYTAGLSFGGIGLPATGGTTGLPGAVGQNIQREKLNLTLNVTPHISANDMVRIEIDGEIKELGEKDPTLGPTWTERKLKTQVVVRDQQTVVLGGLIQESIVYGETKVPILGDIPVLGYLFKVTSKTKRKGNLLILLTPYVIKDQLELQQIRERKERERAEYIRSFSNLNESRFTPRVDYSRKRGLLEEINRTLRSIDADAVELRSLGSQRRVPDGPVNYSVPSDLSVDGPVDAPSSAPSSGGKNPDEDPDAKLDVKVNATLKAAPKPASPGKPVAPAAKKPAPLTPNAKPAPKPAAPGAPGTAPGAPAAAGGSR
jgi:general secretion pathway protein D